MQGRAKTHPRPSWLISRLSWLVPSSWALATSRSCDRGVTTEISSAKQDSNSDLSTGDRGNVNKHTASHPLSPHFYHTGPSVASAGYITEQTLTSNATFQSLQRQYTSLSLKIKAFTTKDSLFPVYFMLYTRPQTDESVHNSNTVPLYAQLTPLT